jgi:hypothetical protein
LNAHSPWPFPAIFRSVRKQFALTRFSRHVPSKISTDTRLCGLSGFHAQPATSTEEHLSRKPCRGIEESRLCRKPPNWRGNSTVSISREDPPAVSRIYARPGVDADDIEMMGGRRPAAARKWIAPFPVSPSRGKPGRAGSPHGGSILRASKKRWHASCCRLPPHKRAATPLCIPCERRGPSEGSGAKREQPAGSTIDAWRPVLLSRARTNLRKPAPVFMAYSVTHVPGLKCHPCARLNIAAKARCATGRYNHTSQCCSNSRTSESDSAES